MTKVKFYSGAADKLRTACQLSHKAMQIGMRVVLHTPNEETAGALDKLLWHYPATAFLPHCHSNETGAADMPVVLDTRGVSFPHSQLLISLHTDCLPFFSRFEQVIEIIGQDEEDIRLGRERFGFYRDRGYEIVHFDLRQNGAA
ncbi:MAG: DNA polymerase III subunit chi [Gallionellaceae bacterium]